MKLRELRKSNNQTQEQIAKILNVAPSTYRGYELYTSEPSLATLIKLADYYNVSLDYLCERPFNNQIGYVQDNRKPTMKKIAELNDKQFDKVEAYVTALIDSEK